MAREKLTVLSQMPVNIFEQSIRSFSGYLVIDWIYEDESTLEVVTERATDIDVVIGVGKPRGLDRFTNLKALLLVAVGYNSVTPDMIPEGCLVANTFEHEKPIADWVIMAMLMLSRGVVKTDRKFRDKSI